jgi:type III secretion system FlhB-like substrate exporter
VILPYRLPKSPDSVDKKQWYAKVIVQEAKMSVFYVTLNEKLQEALANGTYKEDLPEHWPTYVLEVASRVLSRDKKYPVLAVSDKTVIRDDGSLTFKTLYHIPLDTGIINWVPSMLFSYAGLE